MPAKREFFCDHIAVLTPDAERLARFYTQVLGFSEEKKETLDRQTAERIFRLDSELIFIRVQSPGIKIEFFQPRNIRAPKRAETSFGYHHWGFVVKDRAAFCRELGSKKVNIIEINRGTHISYFAEDPDGNLIEIRD